MANWSGDRCSTSRTSRFLMPYSGSPDRPRRPYRARTTRRRTSPTALTANWATWNRSSVSTARGSMRRTADALTLYKPMQTTWTACRHADVARGQPVRGVIGGTALHLPQQPLPAGQAGQAGAPPVREQGVLPGLLIDGEAGPAAAVLIDAQMHDSGRVPVQHRVRGGGERLVRGRPGDPGVPGRLGRGDPPPGDLVPGLIPLPGRGPAARRQLRHLLGEHLPRAPRARRRGPVTGDRRTSMPPSGPAPLR